MKFLKNYKKFSESLQIDVSIINIDINESLSTFYENILKSIGAEKMNIFDKFVLPSEDFNTEIDFLDNSSDFINSLSSIGLKKSSIQNTRDSETFVNKHCRFVLIYRIEAFELENPEYILIQSWNETLSKWENTELYKINPDIDFNKFYDKLSTKEIEIEHDGKKYKYSSQNKNEWTLKDQKGDDTFKKYLRKDELEKIINDNKVRLTIL
jgi:hypothetical protein